MQRIVCQLAIFAIAHCVYVQYSKDMLIATVAVALFTQPITKWNSHPPTHMSSHKSSNPPNCVLSTPRCIHIRKCLCDVLQLRTWQVSVRQSLNTKSTCEYLAKAIIKKETKQQRLKLSCLTDMWVAGWWGSCCCCRRPSLIPTKKVLTKSLIRQLN